MFTNAIVALFTSAALVAAAPAPAPTGTTPADASKTVTLTGVTHSVVAGLAGLRFDPDNVVAQIGDVVEWHFLPKNHSVVRSSFSKPCEPLQDQGFFSGFNFATPEGQSKNVFQIVVQDEKPIWYYCAQTAGAHCQNGMVGVVNQNFKSADFTLAKHKDLAAKTKESKIPAEESGGRVIPNPNPLGGFKL
jgi:plastocyanin